jgi:regulator of sirC expression with transglutaminase-like and TPR domain
MVRRLRRHNAIQEYERKEYKSAENAFRAILEEHPDDAVAHMYLGKIYWDTGGASAAEKALAEYKLAMESDPELPEPHREMGFLYYGLEKYDEAVVSFRTYLSMAPHAIDADEIRQHIRELSR